MTVVGFKGKESSGQSKLGQPHQKAIEKSCLMQTGGEICRPVVTFINTAGAYLGVGAEERGTVVRLLPATSWK